MEHRQTDTGNQYKNYLFGLLILNFKKKKKLNYLKKKKNEPIVSSYVLTVFSGKLFMSGYKICFP